MMARSTGCRSMANLANWLSPITRAVTVEDIRALLTSSDLIL